MHMAKRTKRPIRPLDKPGRKIIPERCAQVLHPHPIAPTILRPRSARKFRASKSMQAIRTATPIST